MSKNRLALHSVAVLAIVVFVFLAISSAASTPQAASKVSTEGGVTTSKGVVHQVSPEPKPYDALGLVFATTEIQYDDKGKEISSQQGIVMLLLKEAQKIGGNDIINLRVDETVSYSSTQEKTSTGTIIVTTKTVTVSGCALAIKYR